MEITYITVPDMNDSVSRITLGGKPYHIRFTYNDTKDFWKFGLYTVLDEPIITGIKIVPRFPINIFYGVGKEPYGLFGVETNLDRIGRYDFANGNAYFFFMPTK